MFVNNQKALRQFYEGAGVPAPDDSMESASTTEAIGGRFERHFNQSGFSCKEIMKNYHARIF